MARSVSISGLGSKAGEELCCPFKCFELPGIPVRLYLGVHLGEKCFQWLGSLFSNRLIKPVIHLPLMDVDYRIWKNFLFPLQQTARVIGMDVSKKDVSNLLRLHTNRSERSGKLICGRPNKFR